MKKSLNKVIVTLAAVTALTAAMAVTASAAVKTEQLKDGDNTIVNATVDAKAAGEQVTMLVLQPGVKPEQLTPENLKDKAKDYIAYIDQAAAEAAVDINGKPITDINGKPTYVAKFKMNLGKTTAGKKYELLSGRPSATKADTGEVVIPSAGEKIHYGDVNDDRVIDSLDALQAQYFSLKMNGVICTYTDEAGNAIENPTINAELFTRANVNKDDAVDGLDALQMQYYSLKDKGHVIDDSWNPNNKWSKE